MEQRVSLREVNQHLTRYVKAAAAGERIVITQEAALERILNRSHHLGGKAPARDELYDR